MKKLFLLFILNLSFIYGWAQSIDSTSALRKFVEDSIKRQPDKINASTLNKAFTGIISFLPNIVNDTIEVLSPKHGACCYQKKDKTSYVYDKSVAPGLWRPVIQTPYANVRIYTVLLECNSGGTVTITTLQNTIGNVLWSPFIPGTIEGNIPAPIVPDNKIFVTITDALSNTAEGNRSYGAIIGSNTIFITSYFNGTATYNFKIYLEIRIYP